MDEPTVLPILGCALISDARSQVELLNLAEHTLKPALMRIPGISQVQIQGDRRRAFRIAGGRSRSRPQRHPPSVGSRPSDVSGNYEGPASSCRTR